MATVATTRPRGLSPERLSRVIEHIRVHNAERCTLDELAHVAAMSVFHFSRMFRRTVGLSPHQFLTRQRMSRACELLEGTDVPIAEIARQVGFRTQSHFTNAFRRLISISPGAYRMRSRLGAVGVFQPGILASMSAREIDCVGGTSGSRSPGPNQAASAISAGSQRISPPAYSAVNATMSECGNGHDWLPK